MRPILENIRMNKTVAFPLALAAVLGTAGGAFAAGDPEAGAETFNTICITCHMEGAGALAPSLHGVVGRKAASEPNFTTYTEALKKLDVTWTVEELDKFIAAPMTVAPGTTMIFPVVDDTQRADVIAFLETLSH
jgi:cytochrome c